jgi:hypothetical protein
MTRVLQPELLDELPPSDPRAVHSRRDLRRINAVMGNGRALARFVEQYVCQPHIGSPISIVEIGAGEGYIAAQVARALSARGVRGNLLLVDRIPQKIAPVENWALEVVEADVFAWLDKSEPTDVIIANLFLHHFSDERLRELLGKCARLCDCFAAAEPRRSGVAEWFARRLKLIGCNEVTLHDAAISVRAGFNDDDLSRLWPLGQNWNLVENRAGMFTHFLGATRRP